MAITTTITIKTFLTVAPRLRASRAILMRGPTGVGKSHLAKHIAKVHNLPLIDVRGSTMSEGDVGGYPDIEGMKERGVMTFCMPSWFVRACNEPCVLLLDELNRSLPGVQQSFFQLVLDRELGNDENGVPYKLHPETRVVAAVNHGSEYDVNEMDPALLRRFWVADIQPDTADWIAWAENNDIDSLLIEFIRNNPQHLRVDPSTVEPGTVVPCPAVWAELDGDLKEMLMAPTDTAGKSNPAGMYALCLGTIGLEAAQAFCKYVQEADKQLTIKDVFAGKITAEVVKEMPNSIMQALIENLGNHAKDNNWTKKQCKAVGVFGDLLPKEQLASLWNHIAASDNLKNIGQMNMIIGMKVVASIQASRKLK